MENTKKDVEDDWDLCEDIAVESTTAVEHENKSKAAVRQAEVIVPECHSSKLTGKLKEPPTLHERLFADLGSGDLSIRPSASARPSPAAKSTRSIIKSLGYHGRPDDIPRSLYIATKNQFTREQLEEFKQDALLAFSHPLPYFFSGSFMFPSCLRAVTKGTTLLGIAKSMTRATLSGYSRLAVRGQAYPAMLPDPDPRSEASVEGMLVFGMLESQRRSIHAFENGMFDLRRTKVDIQLQNGEMVEVDAGVYVWNGSPARLVPKKEREWKVDDLMESQWFQTVIAGAKEEEALLLSAGIRSDSF